MKNLLSESSHLLFKNPNKQSKPQQKPLTILQQEKALLFIQNLEKLTDRSVLYECSNKEHSKFVLKISTDSQKKKIEINLDIINLEEKMLYKRQFFLIKRTAFDTLSILSSTAKDLERKGDFEKVEVKPLSLSITTIKDNPFRRLKKTYQEKMKEEKVSCLSFLY
jgi:hypothetical protein